MTATKSQNREEKPEKNPSLKPRHPLPSIQPGVKVLVIGHEGHGKKSVARFLEKEIGLSWQESFLVACEKAVYPVLREEIGYDSLQACYEDRGNHQGRWRELLRAYNNPVTRLAYESTAEVDVHVGMSSRQEFDACMEAGLFDVVIGVVDEDRVPFEPASSFELDLFWDSNLLVGNNENEETLHKTLRCGLCVTEKIAREHREGLR